MKRSKKWIIAVVVTALILAGTMGGAVLADDGNGSSPLGSLWDRICEIYQQKTGVAIDQTVLKDAISQARDEMQLKTMEERLQSLVEQGQITQEQADEYLNWWQARPDVPFGVGFKGFKGFPGMRGPGVICAPVE